MPATDPLYTVRDGHLCFDGVDLVDLAADRETPFFVFSERRLRANVEAVVGSFRRFHPATEVFYASKACSNLWFLRVARDAGANVEVNAGGELDKALAAGFEPRQIVFNGVAKTRDEIARAVACGVRAFMVDSAARAGPHRRGGGRPGRGGRRRAAHRRPRAHADAPRPRDGARRQGRHRPRRRGDRVPPRRRAPQPRAGRHAPAHRLADHQRRAVPAGARRRARPRRRGGGRRRRAAAVPQRRRRLRRAVPRGAGDVPPQRLLLLAARRAADYAEVVGGALAARRPDLALFLEPGRSIAATTAVLVARVENEKTKGRRDAAGRRIGDERWVTVDAGFNTLLEHTNYALVLPHGRRDRAPARRRTRTSASPARSATAATSSPATPTRRTAGSRRRRRSATWSPFWTPAPTRSR